MFLQLLVILKKRLMLIMLFEELVNRHILITGGNGFIGSHLSKGLTKVGYKVTTVSRSVGDNDCHICVDLTDRRNLVDLANQLESVDTIIHCAAIAHGEIPPQNWSVSDFNSSISKNMIEVFNRRQIRWIFISSISIYGDLHSEFTIPLTRLPKPSDSYGLGKLRDEGLFLSNCSQLDILRLMPVYSSQNLQDIGKRVFLPSTNLKVMIRPTPFYSICNVEAVLTAVKKCMHHKSGQRITQVGDPQPVSQEDLVDWFPGRCIALPQFLFKAIVYFLPKNVTLFRNISFLLKKFGLNNIYEVGSIELGLEDTTSRDL